MASLNAAVSRGFITIHSSQPCSRLVSESFNQLNIMTVDASQLSEGLESLDIVLHPVRMLPREIIGHICELAIEDLQRPSESTRICKLGVGLLCAFMELPIRSMTFTS
ncbi:hypothetical protein BDZ89DRAFT_1151971 [Hymenopellis radicata]|nr:hypothetical protein BDZ89DRAFT_1151971 [Hymenopellis radicata]